MKAKKALFLLSILGISFGVFYYYLSQKYIATGSFLVKRNVETETNNYFSYEGYYAHQTAESFTETVVALLESQDLISQALKENNIPINEASVRKFKNSITVKKPGPQLVTLSLKADSKELAEKNWNNIAKILDEKINEYKTNGDSKIEVSKINETPVVKESYRSLPVFAISGGIIAFGLGLLIISMKEYL